MMEKIFKEKFVQMTGSGEKQKGNDVSKVSKNTKTFSNNKEGQSMVKSPSDTTIYAPALNKRVGLPVGLVQKELQELNMNPPKDFAPQIMQSQNETIQPEVCMEQTDSGMIMELNNQNQIANFVETVRMTNHPEDLN